MSIQRLDHVNFITHSSEETIAFYCDIIGLELGNRMAIDTSQSLYFHIKGDDVAVLHIGQAAFLPDKNKFERFAQINEDNHGEFSTGPFDHFCLVVDDDDYQIYLERFQEKAITYQSYTHSDRDLKQLWLLDPNGVRVELNFIPYEA